MRLRDRAWLPGLVVLVQALLLFESALYSVVTPVLPHYARTLGASKPEVGVLAAAYTAGLIPGALLGGWMAARIGVRRTSAVGLIVFAGAVAAFGFGASIIVLDLLRALQGLACGLIWGGALTWAIAAAPPERRGEVLGSVIGAAVFGTLVGPALGTVAVAVGTRPAFAAIGGVSLALAAWVLAYDEPPPPEPSPRPRATDLFRNGGLVLGAWLVTLEAIAIGAANALIPLRLARLGASGVAVGATFLLASALGTLVAVLVGRESDRRGATAPMTVGLILAGALLVVVALPASAVALAVLSVIVLGGPLTAVGIPAASLLTQSAERAGVALVVATMLFNLAWAIGETVGAPAAASLAQATSDAVPFIALAGVMALTVRPVLAARRHAAGADAARAHLRVG
jgi:predicted MFS family arabinose efflux permease